MASAKLIVGEVIVPGERFPGLYIELDGKRYLVVGDASKFGYAFMEAARWAVSRVDIDVLRPVVASIEVTPL